jgi:hypothetical protein
VSFWRQPKFNTRFKSGGVVPDANLARSEATGKATVEDVVVPEIFSPYTRNLVSAKTLLALVGVEPSFEGVGDTLGDGLPGLTPYSQQDYAAMECVWCGGYGTHKPDCKAPSRNYPRTSLSTQRDMTNRLRLEMDRTVERAYYNGSGSPSPSKLSKPEPPKDERTDLQKRFDAIAEELEENKS